MKLLPYKKILKFSKEKIEESLAPIRARQAKKQAELEMAKLDEKIATLESKITEKASEHPIDFHQLIDMQDELALVERKRTMFEKNVQELFPDKDD